MHQKHPRNKKDYLSRVIINAPGRFFTGMHVLYASATMSVISACTCHHRKGKSVSITKLKRIDDQPHPHLSLS